MILRFTWPLAWLASLLFIAYFGSVWPRRVDGVRSEAYSSELRAMQALDYRLTGELMKARAGLVGHYDGLVETELALEARQRSLRDMPAFLSGSERKQLGRLLQEAERLRQQTEGLVERWKSANAVLRNSLRFMPRAADALSQLDAHEPRDASVRAAADALARDVTLLQDLANAETLERVTRELKELSSVAASMPSEPSEPLQVLLMHAGVVRAYTPVVNELTRAVVAQRSTAQTEKMMAAYASYHRAALAATSRDTQVLFALALVSVLTGALSIIQRLRRSAAELRETSRELEQAVASLRTEQEKQRELAELKTRFVSMTSHEFRTPLSMILSSSELLAAYGERWSADKKHTHFGRIRAAVLGMTRMLDGILLIGRSDAGMLTFQPSLLDLRRCCTELVLAVQDGWPGQRVVLDGPAEGDAMHGDEALLRHVLENLLSNALKYSPADATVKLTVWREHIDVCFSVADRGIGIPEQDRARLFETFHRGSNVGSAPGSGLGLSIAKRAVELHGGTLELDTQLGVGTTFTVRIPDVRCEA